MAGNHAIPKLMWSFLSTRMTWINLGAATLPNFTRHLPVHAGGQNHRLIGATVHSATEAIAAMSGSTAEAAPWGRSLSVRFREVTA